MRSRVLPLLVCLGACAGLVLATAGDAEARAKKKKSHGGAVRKAHRLLGPGGGAVGKFHLRRANVLAGSNHCEQAVREYTLAYQKLRDPVVLFNRGECYRRMGEAGRAASDYRGFLKGVPQAPNRDDIEARIAVLEGSSAPAEPKPAPPPPEPKPKPAAPPVVTAAASAPAAPPAPKAAAPAPTPALGLDDETMAAPALVDVKSAAATAEKSPPPRKSRWWVWVTLGVVVAGGSAAGYVLLRPQGQTIPTTALGDYRF